MFGSGVRGRGLARVTSAAYYGSAGNEQIAPLGWGGGGRDRDAEADPFSQQCTVHSRPIDEPYLPDRPELTAARP